MPEISIIVPTSPCPIHPSTDLIEEVIASIRRHLPDAPLYLLCDGVRSEVEFRRAAYQEYLYRLANLWSKEWDNVTPIIFDRHRQQAGMLKEIIDRIQTPLLLFCEHDATLDDKPIDWNEIKRLLLMGYANTVRFYWHCEIHPEHTHLMLDREGAFVKTIQWSSWPYVSRVDFHKQILKDYFSGDDCKMTETVLYSPCLTFPWDAFKTMIYAPQGDAIRFHHHNSRVDPSTGQRDPGNW